MSKPRVYKISTSDTGARPARDDNPGSPTEPLSGSKKVKNRNHSRQNRGNVGD